MQSRSQEYKLHHVELDRAIQGLHVTGPVMQAPASSRTCAPTLTLV